MKEAESAPSPKTFCRKFGMRNAALKASIASEAPRKYAKTLCLTTPTMRLSRMPAPTRNAPLPVLWARRLSAASDFDGSPSARGLSAIDSPAPAPKVASVSPATWSDSPRSSLGSTAPRFAASSLSLLICRAGARSPVLAVRKSYLREPRAGVPASCLKLVVFNLRQERLVADAEAFGGARLVALGGGEGVGYLAALDGAHGALGRLRER